MSASGRSLAVLAAALAAAAFSGGTARAAPGLLVGVADDSLKSEPEPAASAIRSLGATAVRLTVAWHPGETAVGAEEAGGIDRAFENESGLRIVLDVYGPADGAPQTDAARDAYCAYVASLLARYSGVTDVVVWNEPNKATFWRPQFNPDGTSAAPAAYGALLARCYDVLHAFRPNVNVIHGGLSSTGNDRPDAVSNVSHSPGSFIRREGDAYRASGRRLPLFDTFGHHPYGETAAERPWTPHPGSTLALGDWDKLLQALWDAFAGTGQPLPGEGTPIWYLELGYQTQVPADKGGLYTGAENVETLPALAGGGDSGQGPGPDQATQLGDALRLAYCQPYVGAFFNFLLWDERDLSDWQSGPFWVNRTAKPSLPAVQQAIAEVERGAVDCSALKGGPVQPFVPKQGVDVERVTWPRAGSFHWRNDVWRFRIQTGEDASYEALVYRLGGEARSPVLARSGELRKLYYVFVRFPTRRLPAGRYTMQIVLTSAESAARTATLRSPPFTVRARPFR